MNLQLKPIAKSVAFTDSYRWPVSSSSRV